MDPPLISIDYESRRTTKRRPSRTRSSLDPVQIAMGTVLALFAAVLLLAGAVVVLAAVVRVAGKL